MDDPRVQVVSSTPLTSPDIKRISRLMQLFGPTMTKFTVLPNFKTLPDGSISGFSAEFSADAPMFPDICDSHNFLTGGVSVFSIDAEPSGDWLHSSRKPHTKLIDVISTNGQQTFSLQTRDPKTGRDDSSFVYSPTLGSDHSAVAGIYSGVNPLDTSGKQSKFIVVQASIPRLSEDLVKKINDHVTFVKGAQISADGPSVYTGPRKLTTSLSMADFVDMPDVRYAMNAGSRNRAAIAESIASKFGLTIDKIPDFASSNSRIVGVPTIDQQNFSLVRNASGGFSLFSNALNAERAHTGACISVAPTSGMVVLLDGAGKSTNAWCNEYSNAFPASMARTMSASAALECAARYDAFSFSPSKNVSHPFCWRSNDPISYNDKLHHASYQVRDGKYKAAEVVLGRDHTVGVEMNLYPVCSFVPPTPVINE
jgi:hypothetical protein